MVFFSFRCFRHDAAVFVLCVCFVPINGFSQEHSFEKTQITANSFVDEPRDLGGVDKVQGKPLCDSAQKGDFCGNENDTRDDEPVYLTLPASQIPLSHRAKRLLVDMMGAKKRLSYEIRFSLIEKDGEFVVDDTTVKFYGDGKTQSLPILVRHEILAYISDYSMEVFGKISPQNGKKESLKYRVKYTIIR